MLNRYERVWEVDSKSADGSVSPYCRAIEIDIWLSMLLIVQLERLSFVMIFPRRGCPQNTLLGCWCFPISKSQSRQVMKMIMTHNWEAVALPLTILMMTFNHQRAFCVLSRPGWYIQTNDNDPAIGSVNSPSKKSRIKRRQSEARLIKASVSHAFQISDWRLVQDGKSDQFRKYTMMSSSSLRTFWGKCKDIDMYNRTSIMIGELSKHLTRLEITGMRLIRTDLSGRTIVATGLNDREDRDCQPDFFRPDELHCQSDSTSSLHGAATKPSARKHTESVNEWPSCSTIFIMIWTILLRVQRAPRRIVVEPSSSLIISCRAVCRVGVALPKSRDWPSKSSRSHPFVKQASAESRSSGLAGRWGPKVPPAPYS